MTTASALGATAVFAAIAIVTLCAIPIIVATVIYWLDDFDRYAGTDIEPAPDIREQIEAEHAGVFYQPQQHARRDMRERLGGGRGVGHHGQEL